MQELMIRGGPLMWPLAACSLIALAVILERGWFWFRLARRRDRELINRLFSMTEEGRFDEAAAAGAQSPAVTVRVLTAGLVHRNYDLPSSMEAAAMAELEHMKRGLGVLDTIITLAPLLGILGTVSGIILSFDLLSEAGIQNPRAVTGGIAQALITTATGLAIAIVTVIPYNALNSKTDKVARYLENIATHFELTYRKGLERLDEAEHGKGPAARTH
ncbi:MotA/TolQ/ExbB proton channel family protein [Kiritimatiella glycovorans]|uniref:Biopolymer transport protein ExbB n=1 Tax=Kiritimatiella glycovorans TaxID=1307763 RepID=A0A0G3EG45_9BACT|nr:MotA/TolQ/ExbB proton channel family protein [Kiritimatiella glycovorans]AKJ64362.1 Biopolymer transport protein ExbB [Kiritimatiella glycovorans]